MSDIQFPDVVDVRQRIQRHEAVTDEELAPIITFLREGRASAAVSNSKAAKAKAKKDAADLPIESITSLFD